MKTTRRDFIKMAFSAMMMALGMPKKAETEPSECSRIGGIVAEPTVTIYDLLGDFNESVKTDVFIPGDSLEVVVEPDLYDQFKAALDRCDCDFEIQVHYEQCSPLPEGAIESEPTTEWKALHVLEGYLKRCELLGATDS